MQGCCTATVPYALKKGNRPNGTFASQGHDASSFFILHYTKGAARTGHAPIFNSQFSIFNFLIAEAADGIAVIH